MSKAKAPRVFVPLTKVDEEQRLVYGTITQEILDKAGEVMDYETSKPHFEKWSQDIHTASGGLSKGNVRVMHGLNVAGKLTELEFNDDDKSIEVCAKVVDDKEWEKVVEGCYTGFSVGGNYGKKWTETVDGAKVKKFEAKPNEVSLVDNPCVPSATFAMVKADGAEEQVEFKVENDDDLWPAFSKADAVKAEAEPGVTNDDEDAKDDKKKSKKKVEKAVPIPTNEQVVAKAEEMAKAAGNGSSWMDHVVAARDELTKAMSTTEGDQDEGSEEEAENSPTDEGAENTEAGDEGADSVEKVTPAGVKQVWTASDGTTFEKKAEAEAHEATLIKTEPTEAEKLKARLEKALSNEEEPAAVSIFSLDRIDDLHKAVLELELPRDETGAPKLEKGMYTVSRFANMIGDVASLARTIKSEGKLEGDAEDENIAKTLTTQLSSFGDSFMIYAKQQIAEVVAGLDNELSPRCAYDYYYRAAGEDNDLAKNVVELIESVEDEREEAAEGLEKLAKSFGFVSGTLESTDADVLSPPMQKRFDTLEAENNELKKIASDAVDKIEELAKRMKAVEDTPLPRAPRNVVSKGEEGTFLGKAATTEEDKINVLHEMIKTHGPDELALMMIKASHQNGQPLSLKKA